MLDKIKALKEEKDVAILAHYYVDGELQQVADMVGDSYALAKQVKEVENRNIVFCGVSFMGESAKLLNPTKHVYMVDVEADCPMAHMVTGEDIKKVREAYPDVAVVCYVNSTAEIKSLSDVCVTSSNALQVVRNLKTNHIFFIPDMHLGQYVAQMVPEKQFIFHNGYCPIHHEITAKHIRELKEVHKKAFVMIHPECPLEACNEADFVGSTKEMIIFATESKNKEFIVCTEEGIFHELQTKNPDKVFWPCEPRMLCEGMKRQNAAKLLQVLEQIGTDNPPEEVLLDEGLSNAATNALEQMIILGQ
ncbi:MAG: quinolinate synthase NadA [Lachnospiraceae bacterium]